ncbi:hypothetical protein LshimejAT787_1301770 [Lyophyllum shimeji]|uniref:Uncharacterized protein n=1 Tax=Lyophyllum shimeji TaxID=47721 RepID=A0A9P3PY40_LYOSH|nr:hypothetical protein LshimejAT787_1301770 [Lyophyllum shimeji]
MPSPKLTPDPPPPRYFNLTERLQRMKRLSVDNKRTKGITIHRLRQYLYSQYRMRRFPPQACHFSPI